MQPPTPAPVVRCGPALPGWGLVERRQDSDPLPVTVLVLQLPPGTSQAPTTAESLVSCLPLVFPTRLIAENPSRRLQVDLSIAEVYNNNIFDLLAKARGMETSGRRREALTTKDTRREVPLLTRE